MKDPPETSKFNSTTAVVAPFVARVSLSITQSTVTTRAVLYSDVRCPNQECGRVIIAVPGDGRNVEAKKVRSIAERSGRGPALTCKRCKTLVEVVIH